MTTLDELAKLLAAATPGPWKIERGKRCIQGPDTFEGDPVIIGGLVGGSRQWSNFPFSEYCVPGKNEGDANAALICAAVNALPELIAVKAERDKAQRACEQMGARITELLEENEKLREALRLFMGAATPVSTEIDPRGYVWSLGYLDQARTALKETGQ